VLASGAASIGPLVVCGPPFTKLPYMIEIVNGTYSMCS
jgi:hypothetical protein